MGLSYLETFSSVLIKIYVNNSIYILHHLYFCLLQQKFQNIMHLIPKPFAVLPLWSQFFLLPNLSYFPPKKLQHLDHCFLRCLLPILRHFKMNHDFYIYKKVNLVNLNTIMIAAEFL